MFHELWSLNTVNAASCTHTLLSHTISYLNSYTCTCFVFSDTGKYSCRSPWQQPSRGRRKERKKEQHTLINIYETFIKPLTGGCWLLGDCFTSNPPPNATRGIWVFVAGGPLRPTVSIRRLVVAPFAAPLHPLNSQHFLTPSLAL